MRAGTLLMTVAGVSFLVGGCGPSANPPTTPTNARVASPESQDAGTTTAGSPEFSATKAKLKLDQSNDVTDHLGLGNGLYGQTFVPKAKNLARVDLLAIINNLPEPGIETTAGLFADITQPPIATTSTFVEAPAPGELRRTISFWFDPPIPLEKGVTYTIGLYAPRNVSWEFAFGDPYPDGQVVLYDGTPLNPPADFVFATYELK